MALQNVPQANQTLNATQAPILTNFTDLIDPAFSQNHVPYGSGVGNQGKHMFLQMPQQAGAPATLALEGGLAVLAGATSGNPELNWIPQNSGNPIAFTEGTLATVNGWSRLASGLLIKWGTAAWTAQNDATTTLNFPMNTVGPAFGTCFQVIVTTLGGVPTSANSVNIYIQVVAIAATNFTAKGSTRTSTNDNRNFPFQWFAIGM